MRGAKCLSRWRSCANEKAVGFRFYSCLPIFSYPTFFREAVGVALNDD
jgi:hypothetical protein